MTTVPVGVPVAWTCPGANDLHTARSSIEIDSDCLRHRRLFR